MLNLLIVSPSSFYAEAIELYLQGPEIEINCIDPSQCIVECCQQRNFNLIIFLAMAPYFTSMNIIESLQRQNTKTPQIYVISHSHAQSTILTLLECGVNQYMTFPVNLYRLRDKVYKLIQ